MDSSPSSYVLGSISTLTPGLMAKVNNFFDSFSYGKSNNNNSFKALEDGNATVIANNDAAATAAAAVAGGVAAVQSPNNVRSHTRFSSVGHVFEKEGDLKIKLNDRHSIVAYFFGTWTLTYVAIVPHKGIVIAPSKRAFFDDKNVTVIPFSDISSVAIYPPSTEIINRVVSKENASNIPTLQPKTDTKIQLNATSSSSRKLNQDTPSVISPSSLSWTFEVVLKKNAQKKWSDTSIWFETRGEKDAQSWADHIQDKLEIKARIYRLGPNREFPESYLSRNPIGNKSAICFNGGGGRAHVAACGQLRALFHLGLLNSNDINYMSGVSAGSWATGIYCFYKDGADDDAELLGDVTNDLATVTMITLNKKPSPLAGVLGTSEVFNMAKELVWSTNPHQLWQEIIGKLYLKPFGLHENVPFCRPEDYETIIEKNPQLKSVRFNIAHEGKPYWVAHGTIIGPQWARLGDIVPIQFTPLYCGTPFEYSVHYRERRGSEIKREEFMSIGGAMLDSFAFGGNAPDIDENGEKITKTLRNKKALLSAIGKLSTSFKKISKSDGSADGNTNPVSQTATTSRMIIDGMQATKEMFKQHDANENQNNQPLENGEVIPSSTESESSNDVQNTAVNVETRTTTLNKKTQAEIDSESPMKRRQRLGLRHVKDIAVPHPQRFFSLKDALGISSDAPSYNLHDKNYYNKINSQETIYNPGKLEQGDELFDMGDGGSLDNTGLLGMLQRGVKKCLVFVNTNLRIPSPVAPPVHLRLPSPTATTPNGKQATGVQKDGSIEKKKLSFTDISDEKRTLKDISEEEAVIEALYLHREKNSARKENILRRASTQFMGSTAEMDGTSDKFDNQTLLSAKNGTSPNSIDKGRNSSLGKDKTISPITIQNESDDNGVLKFSEWPCADILPLFGIEVTDPSAKELGNYDKNTVFPAERARGLLKKFQDKWVKGEPIVVKEKYPVQENKFWGINGGWEVEIMWFYLEDSYKFRVQLGKDVQEELNKGTDGHFYRFPNFKTFGARRDKYLDTALSIEQINILSLYTEWVIMQNKDEVTSFLRE